MLTLGSHLKYYCYLNRVDMWKGYNELNGIIQEYYEKKPEKENLKSQIIVSEEREIKKTIFIGRTLNPS